MELMCFNEVIQGFTNTACDIGRDEQGSVGRNSLVQPMCSLVAHPKREIDCSGRGALCEGPSADGGSRCCNGSFCALLLWHAGTARTAASPRGHRAPNRRSRHDLRRYGTTGSAKSNGCRQCRPLGRLQHCMSRCYHLDARQRMARPSRPALL